MPEVISTGTDVYQIMFDEGEAEWLDKHSTTWGLTPCQAVADMFDYAIAAIPQDKGPEDGVTLFEDKNDDSNVGLTVGWPESGAFSLITGDDRRFVAAYLACSLKEALLIVTHKHHT